MKQINNPSDYISLVKKELFTAVVGDILDKLGLHHQFLPPQIKPLHAEMIIIGKAMPVLEMNVFSESLENSNNPLMSEPFGLMFEALDDLKPGEVYICTGASPDYALWGELMSVRALKLGAAGAVVNGYSRDTSGILKLQFPTFSYGGYAQDQGPRGKVADFRIAIEINKVKINNGDWIFGDRDGVLVIPEKVFPEAIELSLEKVRGENKVKQALEEGMSARDAFSKFGIM